MAQQSASSFSVESLDVVDWVGDPSTAGKLEPLFRHALSNKAFLRFTGDNESSEFGRGPGCDKIRNVFYPIDVEDATPHSVAIKVEIEQAYFGKPQSEMKQMLVAIWAFGPLLAALGADNSDVVTGYVQLRVTLSSQDFPDTVTVIGTGAMAGDIEEISRNKAVDLAIVNAAWNTAYLMVEEMNSQWDLGLKPEFVSAQPEEFRRVYDDWVQKR